MSSSVIHLEYVQEATPAKRGGRRAAVAAEVGIAALAAKKVSTNVFYITLILVLLQEATPRKGGRGAAPPTKKATPAPKTIKKSAANVVKDVEADAEETKYGLIFTGLVSGLITLNVDFGPCCSSTKIHLEPYKILLQ